MSFQITSTIFLVWWDVPIVNLFKILLRVLQYGFCYSQSYNCFSHQKVVRAVGNKKCDFYTETRGFECVPYYQVCCTLYVAWIRLIMICKISLIRVELQCDDDGTIITDGAGLIDIRWITIYCSQSSSSSYKHKTFSRFGGEGPELAVLDSTDLMCPGKDQFMLQF